MIALALFVTRRISESSFIGRPCWRTFSSPDMKQNPEKYASALQVTLHKVISVPRDAVEERGARDRAGWQRISKLTDARSRFAKTRRVSIQTDSRGCPIRVGKATEGLEATSHTQRIAPRPRRCS